MGKYFLSVLIILLSYQYNYCQSLTGLTGLLNVPTAELLKDGEISLGVSYLNKKYLSASFKNDDGLAYYVTLGFLPFTELSIRFTKRMAPADALGDRMFSFRIRVIQEKEVIPSILIGIHDPIHSTENRTNRFTAAYLVITKNILIMGPKMASLAFLTFGPYRDCSSMCHETYSKKSKWAQRSRHYRS